VNTKIVISAEPQVNHSRTDYPDLQVMRWSYIWMVLQCSL